MKNKKMKPIKDLSELYYCNYKIKEIEKKLKNKIEEKERTEKQQLFMDILIFLNLILLSIN